MIEAIEGKITKIEPTYIWLKLANGISYGVNVSLFSSAKLILNETKELLITQIIREDANNLYGFLDVNEQKVFSMLLKVSGIGPTTALAVCSSLNPEQISGAVLSGDINTFKKVPGIGPKTAKMLIATLSDANFSLNTDVKTPSNEALMALESLGFKRDKIIKILNTCKATSTAELIKEALKKLA